MVASPALLVLGFTQTIVGSVIGALISQAFDGTVRPLAAGFFTVAVTRSHFRADRGAGRSCSSHAPTLIHFRHSQDDTGSTMTSTTTSTPEAQAVAARISSASSRFVITIALMTATVAMAIDIMLPALPSIGQSLNVTNANDTQLVIAVFFLGFGCSQIVFGSLSDVPSAAAACWWRASASSR